MSADPSLGAEGNGPTARRLVEAAFRVFAATGNTDPSIRPILHEAGLSRQAFYRCFASKDELMDAVLAEGRRLLAEHLTRRMARARTAEGKLRAWIGGVMQQAEAAHAAQRTRPFAVGAAPADGQGHTSIRDTDRILGSLLEQVLLEGNAEGSWDSAEPSTDAQLIHDLTFANLRRYLLLGVAPQKSATNSLIDFALRALRSHDR